MLHKVPIFVLGILFLSSSCSHPPSEMSGQIATFNLGAFQFPVAGLKTVVEVVADGTKTRHTLTVLKERQYQDRPAVLVSIEPLWKGPPVACIDSDLFAFDPSSRNFVACLKDRVERASALPNDGQYDWPLTVGKKWSAKFRWRDRQSASKSGTVRAVYTVEKEEVISVPAGTFSALKIVGESLWQNATIWYSKELNSVLKSDIKHKFGNPYGSSRVFSIEIVGLGVGKL